MADGFVKLHRKTQESWIRRDPVAAHVFFSWFLLEAAWKPYVKEWNAIQIPLEKGEAVFGRIKVAEKLGLSEKQVRNAVNRLTQRASIRAVKRASKFSVYSVVEWDTYQTSDEAEGPANPQELEEARATIKELTKKLEKKSSKPKTPCADESPRFPVEEHFESFWTHYPKRNGKRVGKGDALAKYKLIVKTEETAHLLFDCVTNYADECVQTDSYPMDAKRWLVAKRWEEYKPNTYEAPVQEAQQPQETETQRMIRVAQEMEAQGGTFRITKDN